MIHAQLITTPTHLEVRFSNPQQKFGKEPAMLVSSEQEARRILHFKVRKYVTETLMRWLRQRNYALNQDPTVFKLLSLIQNIEKASLGRICINVRNFQKEFESIKPHEKSRYYAHYQNTILPILEFCKNY